MYECFKGDDVLLDTHGYIVRVCVCVLQNA